MIAAACGDDPENIHHCLTHLAANGEALVSFGATPAADTFRRPPPDDHSARCRHQGLQRLWLVAAAEIRRQAGVQGDRGRRLHLP